MPSVLCFYGSGPAIRHDDHCLDLSDANNGAGYSPDFSNLQKAVSDGIHLPVLPVHNVLTHVLHMSVLRHCGYSKAFQDSDEEKMHYQNGQCEWRTNPFQYGAVEGQVLSLLSRVFVQQ